MRAMSARLLAGLAMALLCACALQPSAPLAPVETLFADASFGPPTQRVSADEVLALSPPMRQYLAEQIMPRLRRQTGRDALLEALYTRSELQLRYDADTTRTAAEAFDARAGNCLSLVLMTAAFAEEMGLPYRFQTVQVGENWGREGNLVMFMGHVNIALGRQPGSLRLADLLEDNLVVDFLPTADLRHQFTMPIDRARVQALYMNNRSAEALAQGQIDNAYWWARGAVAHDPRLGIALNTLGVIYLRHGRLAEADAALRRAMAVEPDSRHAMSNLVQVLERSGQTEEAQAVSQRLRRLQAATAYGQFELGQAAMRQGLHGEARAHFERALRMDRDQHEFHFALAQALVAQGDYEAGARELAAAQEHTGNQLLKQAYAGKLQRLRQQLVH